VLGEDRVVDFSGEGEMTEREVVGHVLSSGAIVSWRRGCVCPPSLGVDMRGVDLHG
jgi:hypothetical protein